jgi:hypothetical protein
VGGNERRQIYVVEEVAGRERTFALPWVAQLAMVTALGPDDFHLRQAAQQGDWFGAGSRGFRLACLFEDEAAAARFRDALKESSWNAELHAVEAAGLTAHIVSFVSRGELPAGAAEAGGTAMRWISRTLLPAFMSRDNY